MSDILRHLNLLFVVSAHSHLLVYLIIFLKSGFICVFFGNPECLIWGFCPPEDLFAFVRDQGTPVTWDHFSLCWQIYIFC